MTTIQFLQKAQAATTSLQALSEKQKNSILADAAHAIKEHTRHIVRANKEDFSKLSDGYPHGDRLLLTEQRVLEIAKGIEAVRRLPDPIGNIIDKRTVQKSGLRIERRTVPIGVLGIIYEARPNVTVEIFSLAIKSSNVVVLKGGRDAYHSNRALVGILKSVLKKHEVNPNAITMLDPLKKEPTNTLLRARQYVDLLIPRGSQRLIGFVRDNASIPTIETGAGVCHTYVERSANLNWAANVVVNAKVRRPSVCNALDTLVVDQSIARSLFQRIAPVLSQEQVVIYADTKSYGLFKKMYPKKLLRHAKPTHFGNEFLSLAMSVKVVKNADEGISFVQNHTSGHSESIITKKKNIAEDFQKKVDAAAVYVNTSTAFTDGFEFGLGAEIGISTQKLHARGPMALQELTTYKWFIESQGAIRPR